MAYQIRKVKYCYLTMPSRAGKAADLLGVLKDEGVDLLAFSGFPAGGGKAQVDLVADKMTGVARVAKKYGWRTSKIKNAFLAQGDDEIGAVEKVLARLAKEDINVTAATAVAAGKGRYGMIFWVNPKKYNKAARALNARSY